MSCPKGVNASFRAHLVIMQASCGQKLDGELMESLQLVIRSEGGQGCPLGGYLEDHAGRAYDGTSAYHAAVETESVGVS